MAKSFARSGHLPTLFAAFLYFDLSFMAWVVLGPLGVQIARDLHLDSAEKGLMVAIPVLAGALFRIPVGFLADRIKPRLTGILCQLIVLAGVFTAWWLGVRSLAGTFALGVILGLAGASFAVALPLASSWFPAEHQGKALGIAGAGNSGTVLAALFAPSLAVAAGWNNVIGLLCVPLGVALAVFVALARNSPTAPVPKKAADYLAVLRIGDCWLFMFLYSVTFGGFVGLASSLTIYFNVQYGLPAVTAGYFAAACVFVGSMVRPLGGAMADRVGGVRALIWLYAIAAAALTAISCNLPQAWLALAIFLIAMLALGAGNGAVFQLVPQRFGREIGAVTGLVGCAGGLGGFWLAFSLGYAKQITGGYQLGFLVFGGFSVVALISLTRVSPRWRATWGSAVAGAARV